MVEGFSLPTVDGKTALEGEIAFPSGVGRRGALIIVPGGWFMDREGFLGDSFTEADFLYRRLAHRVGSDGYHVARYDNRGVNGNELSIGLAAGDDNDVADAQLYLEHCIDFATRATVTPEALASDTEQVIQYVGAHELVEGDNLVVCAHSEGGLHVARLIAANRVSPRGVVLAGVSTESPVATLRWQMIDRYVDEVLSWDTDGDGRVGPVDVERHYESSLFPAVGIGPDELNPGAEPWTGETLSVLFQARYQAEKTAALQADDTAIFPQPEGQVLDLVAASYRWWKQWFTDEQSVDEMLSQYPGEVAFHLGGIDSQLPTHRVASQFRTTVGRSTRRLVVHAGRGHAFRTDEPTSGPMDLEAEDELVAEILSMFRRE